jgi:diguanylate cyclase (GGDEF)-like protein
MLAFNPVTLLRSASRSLERRLTGALALVLLLNLGLQVFSQQRAFDIGEQVTRLQQAAQNAEYGQQLGKTVDQFRLQSRLAMADSEGQVGSAAGAALVDSAVEIGDVVNTIRLNGSPGANIRAALAEFERIDLQVDAVREAAGTGDAAAADRVDAHNARLTGLAHQVEARLDSEGAAALNQVAGSIRDWQLFIALAGLGTLLLTSLVLADLLRTILPSLRRMHGNLRRLAEGDLDVEIDRHSLSELQELSGALETFRRNAVAVRDLAFTDPSSGMPNLRAFIEGVEARLAAPDAQQRPLAIIIADIDRFKHVNDDYGHAAGDRLVKLAGQRLLAQLDAEALVARIGGDEFAICCRLSEREQLIQLGERLAAAMRAPFDMDEFSLSLTMSLGLVEAGPEIDVAKLLNRADVALYATKNGGRNGATLYTEHLEEDRMLDRLLERELAQALGRGEFRMVYQPIHPVNSDLEEVEALVRWRHPELGEISPARFVPAAERSGQMVLLGNWIVETALRDLSHWPAIAMSVNLSPIQLQQDGFAGFLLDCCRRNGILPQRLCLEVTESLSIEGNPRALLMLDLLRQSGFRIALDDFGTGYSSLCLVKTFQFDRLKLDRSLINDMVTDPTAHAVFEAAVTMALRIGAEVVAEGISEETMIDPICQAGCTHLQGYHYSRPIEADEITQYFKRHLGPGRSQAA